MDNLNPASVELVSSARPAPLNGPPSSTDFNAFQNEVISDLIDLETAINEALFPVLRGLVSTAAAGLDGTGLWGNSSAAGTDPVFRDPNGSLYTVSDLISRLWAAQAALQQSGNDLSAQFQALQTRLATTQQNDLRASVQSLQDSVNSLLTQMSSVLALTATQGATLSKRRTQVIAVATEDAAAHPVAVAFTPAFADNNFAASISLESLTGSLALVSWQKQPDHTIQVTVQAGVGGGTGNLHVIAQYLG